MSKVVKEMMIGEIESQLGDCRDLVVLDTSKLDAISTNKIRLQLMQKGIQFLGVKNSLARLALKKAGIEATGSILKGPSTLVWGGEDVVGLSREIAEWVKKVDKVQIKGGFVDGQGVSPEGVEEISKGPSRLELIGQLVGLVLSPGAQLAGALLGPGGTLCGQLKAMSEKDGEGQEEGGDAA